ncbi:GTPase [Saccharomycopsis crataegensis]|uniref:GTPase n=1 Tax=Saccharomycopsis crataegensis TaxID=43959 RepID=A0AAV5QDY4_9ASCO|nr:GTPase [Saccharomycopsis crataegensis]
MYMIRHAFISRQAIPTAGRLSKSISFSNANNASSSHRLLRYNSSKSSQSPPLEEKTSKSSISSKEAGLQALRERIAKIPIENYRNFSIVAHIDHGKSTLSDRLLELTGVIQPGSNKQVLDRLDVERERGITIKAQTCSMIYRYQHQDYLLQLVDCPGHVDFRAEVSRSFAAVGGALLLVDASQGVQAQTVANFYLAYSMDLKLLPIINKIDLPHADIPKAVSQVEDFFELPVDDIVSVSAKTGQNVEKILPQIIEKIVPPVGSTADPLKMFIIDSWYDSFVGVIMLVRIVDGTVHKGMRIISAHTKKKYEIKEVGLMYPDKLPMEKLSAGQVAYIIPGMKNSSEALIGDTFMEIGKEVEPFPGFEESKPMVFVGAFPADGVEFNVLDERLNYLVLNDRSVTLQKETSNALGQGWRLGFLGSLHASVFKERLEKEYGASLIITTPTVPYKLIDRNGENQIITNPDDFPDLSAIGKGINCKYVDLQEPYVEIMSTFPDEYVGAVIQLCDNNRGIQKDLQYLNTGQVLIKYELPLSHLVSDFFGKLKSATRGFASLDYDDAGYKSSDIVKLELLVNGTSIDALSQVMHRSLVETTGREWVKKFKPYVKNHLFEVVIQARANNKIIGRETVKAKRKDVLQKLHAADQSRRKKLLAKQKEGKKKMKSIGRVSVDPDAYQSFLRR